MGIDTFFESLVRFITGEPAYDSPEKPVGTAVAPAPKKSTAKKAKTSPDAKSESEAKSTTSNAVALTDVKGITEAKAKALEEAGIKNAADLAAASADEVAKAKGYGKKTAEKAITEAKNALK